MTALVYLARQYGGNQWWPDGVEQQGDVMQWLSTAANEIHNEEYPAIMAWIERIKALPGFIGMPGIE